jgi:phosphopentomutase
MHPGVSRVIVLVLDGAGIGALPDAAQYGDVGADTLGHVAQRVLLHVPHLQRLGLGNIAPLQGIPPCNRPQAAYGKLAERSAGKDSTVGHWELMGVVTRHAYPTYPQGFPPDVVAEFSQRTGHGVIGNRPASGTAIIEELYAEHRRTGAWIVYTSADSVFQVAAHEDVIPRAELYAACQQAAAMLMARGRVLRVIARPFKGTAGDLRRTSGRRDYNLPAPDTTALDCLTDALCPTVTIGKVDAIFAGRGVTEAHHTHNNSETLEALRAEVELRQPGLVFANLVDFDMTWGHRNDVAGFAAGLEAFDVALGDLLQVLWPGDVLVITADHGCDPTDASTDHTREYVPMLVCGQAVMTGTQIGVRDSFADLGASVCQALGAALPATGASFWPAIAQPIGKGSVRLGAQRMAWLRHRALAG